jgi:cytochrome c oxidase cbb3-type subunit II
MKNGPLFLLGLFLALLISWGSIVLGSHLQLSSLAPYFDEAESQTFPLRMSGLAARGQLVYAELGCAACHTQQVRRPDFGSDQARGFGERQSVARDYIFQPRPQLGASRFGPDLANVGARLPKEAPHDVLYNLLYNGSPTHPGYRFLFEKRRIEGEPSATALRPPAVALPPGHEVVPTERARSLVAYLLGLNNTYVYPESRPVVPEQAAAPAAPAPAEVTPIPAAAPDEKKKQEGKK